MRRALVVRFSVRFVERLAFFPRALKGVKLVLCNRSSGSSLGVFHMYMNCSLDSQVRT